MEHVEEQRWNAKHDVFRQTTEFTDLLKIVACYYEMYSRAAMFVGPWVAKQHGIAFLPPEREQIKAALGKERPAISLRARLSFIEAVITHLTVSRGRKTLITPDPSSHHSAQFPAGTFAISSVSTPVVLRDDRAIRKATKTVHKIEFAGAEAPVFVEDLRIPPDQINFVILRPKLGKLGTASTNKWEVLLFKKQIGYMVDHVDSTLNPRWAGKM